MTDVQFTMSLTTLFQGLIAIVFAIIGWFIKREFANMDVVRKEEAEARKQLCAALEELRGQRRECMKEFASKDAMVTVFSRLEQHTQEIGHLQGWQHQHDRRHKSIE